MLPENVPLQLVYIPPGTLDVNSVKTERWMTEEAISVERGFYIGKYEVTVERYRRFLEETRENAPMIDVGSAPGASEVASRGAADGKPAGESRSAGV